MTAGTFLQVTPETRSEGHHFKLRDIVLFTEGGDPCVDYGAGMLRFVAVRSGLTCEARGNRSSVHPK